MCKNVVATTKKLLFVISTPPYASSRPLEALEAVLVAGVFEQQVSVLLRDDAVWGLLPGQDGRLVGQRTFGKVINSLAAYDINRVFACADAVAQRQLVTNNFVLPVEVLNLAGQQELIAASDAVLGAGA